jgi:ADP-ribosylation factor-like protein 1
MDFIQANHRRCRILVFPLVHSPSCRILSSLAGGQTSIRPYWRCYYANTAAVVFVVDATDHSRLETAAEELAAMLNEEELREAALLVFANKQDQPGVLGAAEISEALKLASLKERSWSIFGCSAVTGDGEFGQDALLKRRTEIFDRCE